jgi:hypothetical protein
MVTILPEVSAMNDVKRLLLKIWKGIAFVGSHLDILNCCFTVYYYVSYQLYTWPMKVLPGMLLYEIPLPFQNNWWISYAIWMLFIAYLYCDWIVFIVSIIVLLYKKPKKISTCVARIVLNIACFVMYISIYPTFNIFRQ